MRVAALAASAGLCAAGAWAHEAGSESPVPAQPGVKATAAAAIVGARSGSAVPPARLPGVLDTGVPAEDLRDHPLEHATLQFGARLDGTWSAAAGWGWHGTDPAHSEAAWLQWEGRHQRVRLGRQGVDRGAVLDTAGHFDRFLQAPLIVRAAFDGPWDDDGVQWRWQSDDPGAHLQVVDAGLWRAGHFPASGAHPAAGLHVHPQWQWGDTRLDAFAARLRVRHRGQALVSATGAHSHATPDCAQTLVQLACFDGTAWLYGGSVQWAPDGQAFGAQAAWMMRDERGDLYSASGNTDYRGRTQGAWIDLGYRLHADWRAAVRLERLVPTHRLADAGAALVASETGLSLAGPTSRATAMVSWQVRPSLALLTEAGRTTSAGASAQRHAAIRLVWRGALAHP